jgi:hypothetical protein
MNDLEEYRRNKPLIDRIKQLEYQLGKKERKSLVDQKISAEQIENSRLIQKWRMSSS